MWDDICWTCLPSGIWANLSNHGFGRQQQHAISLTLPSPRPNGSSRLWKQIKPWSGVGLAGPGQIWAGSVPALAVIFNVANHQDPNQPSCGPPGGPDGAAKVLLPRGRQTLLISGGAPGRLASINKAALAGLTITGARSRESGVWRRQHLWPTCRSVGAGVDGRLRSRDPWGQYLVRCSISLCAHTRALSVYSL